MDIAAELKNYLDALRSRGTDPTQLLNWAQTLVPLPDAEFATALAAFNLAVDASIYYATNFECDFGALLLEALADARVDVWRSRRLYLEVKRRAGIFASYSTSGGEGLARSREVERLARKIEDLEARALA